MTPAPSRAPLEDELLVQTYARLDPRSLGLALGMVGGIALAAATAVLLVKAVLGIDPASPVGPHLSRLGAFFPGFRVTWRGALIGLGYGFASGFLLGVTIAVLLNLQRLISWTLLLRRARRSGIDDGL